MIKLVASDEWWYGRLRLGKSGVLGVDNGVELLEAGVGVVGSGLVLDDGR